jgi:hypothetical protein
MLKVMVLAFVALGATGWAQVGVPADPTLPPPPGHDTHFGYYSHPHQGYNWVWNGREYELRYGPYGHDHYGTYWQDHTAQPVQAVPQQPVTPPVGPGYVRPGSFYAYPPTYVQPCNPEAQAVATFLAFGALIAALAD